MKSLPCFLSRALVLFCCLVVTGPLVADVLVTRDGSRVEIDGGWTVDGRLVKFTLPDGTLSVMRLSEIDLDASEQATAEAAAPPPPPPPPVERKPVEPVLVLTDADIPAGEGAPPAAAEDGESTEGSESSTEESFDPDRPVEVSEWSWRAATVDGGLWELEGTVVNRGDRAAYNLQVYFTAIGLDENNQPDPEMDLLRPATVIAEELEPGESTTFTYVVTAADLRGEPSRFAEPQVDFDLRYRLRAAPTPVPSDDVDDGDSAGEDADESDASEGAGR